MTESVYQGLRPFIPSTLELGKDTRSIHFLPFPEVRSEYFDTDIERKVTRMQAVIELGRALREKHSLSLKVCSSPVCFQSVIKLRPFCRRL